MPSSNRTVSSLALALLLAAAASAQVGLLEFVNVAPEAGATAPSYGRGAAMVDLDGDALPDLVAANDSMANAFLRQEVDGTFTNMNATWGIPPNDTRPTWGVVATDFDEDGDIDVYFFNGGFIGSYGNQMLRNGLDTSGLLVDVSIQAGLAGARQTFGATAVDYDLDGDLDIFNSNTDGLGCQLFRNDGALVFTDVSAAAGVDQPTALSYRHCGAGDIDGDGWFEIGVGNAGGDNLLFHNEGDGTFVEIAAQAGVTSPMRNFGFVFEDVDNDGDMDVYLPKLILPPNIGLHPILLNDGTGVFTDITDQLGMEAPGNMGHNIGDLDADGYPEVYIGTGSPDIIAFDKMYRLEPDAQGELFATDISVASGITSAGVTRTHGMAFGDVDRDGDIDIYQNNGGPELIPESIQENFLWENQGNEHEWIAVVPRGVLAPRSGVGTHGVAYTTDGREIHRTVQAGKGFGNTDRPVLHFGLGESEGIERIELHWTSGIRQTLLAPEVGQRINTTETGMRVVGETKLGQPISLQIVCRSTTAADLFASLGALELPLPALDSVLEIAPPFYPFGTYPLDNDGVFTLPIQIPNLPALDGLTLYMQALVRDNKDSALDVLTNGVALEFTS